MAFSFTDFGITAISTALVERFRLKKLLQMGSPVFTSAGLFHTNEAYAAEWEFSAEGKGDLPADFALAGTAPTIAGVVGGLSFIDANDERQQTGEEASWEGSGVNFPDASVPI